MFKREKIIVSIFALAAMNMASLSAQESDEPNPEIAPEVTNHVCGAVIPDWKVPALTNPKTSTPKQVGCAVAAWQLKANQDLSYLPYKILSSSYDRGWVKATFYVGLEEYAAAIGDDGFMARIRQYAYNNGLEIGDRPWHGDDQTVTAIYGKLAIRDNNPSLMDKSIKQFDLILEENFTHSLEFSVNTTADREGGCQTRWCWADAIFMAPPSWALATKISGDQRYLDYAVKETKAVLEYLRDEETGLIFRDSRFFDQRTPNGKKVFWSRGNGWVFAGLARFIDVIPEGHKDRDYMVKAYQDLADKLVPLQREDGYWPTSLADADYLKNPESSGTAFFGYGMAWGLNNGLLKGAQYEKARDLAWDAMRDATNTNGKVGWVQQIGKDPVATDRESSQLYTAGGMLLFASQMVKK